MEAFSDSTLNSCLKLKKVILSGNLDECSIKKQIIDKQYKTIILFNDPKTEMNIKLPELEKYTEFIKSNDGDGFVKLKMN